MATNSKAKNLTKAFSIVGIFLAVTLFVLMSFGAYTVATKDISGMETILNILLLMGPSILIDLGLLGALLIAWIALGIAAAAVSVKGNIRGLLPHVIASLTATVVLAAAIIVLGYLGSADSDATYTFILWATIAAGFAGATAVYGTTAGFVCSKDM